MNALVNQRSIVGNFSEFFAPVSPDLIGALLSQHAKKKALIERLHQTMQKPEIRDAMTYFVDASKRKHNDRGTFLLDYDQPSAIACLDAEFWQKALNLTDVYEHMPQKRRDEWHEMIGECKCVPFEEDAVYGTIENLLHSRAQFFSERVDGMFRSLSGEHVTNSPTGFSKRMIVANVIDSLGLIDWKKAGHLDDLRKVIAKFLGRSESGFGDSRTSLHAMMKIYGEWVELDGGALRAKLFKKGTVHLEVHPDIAWKLNEVLAFLYPKAISSSALKKPTRPSRDFGLIKHPISSRVVEALAESIKTSKNAHRVDITWRVSKEVAEQVIQVLESIGGVRSTYTFSFDRWSKPKTMPAVEFDYNPADVIAHIVCSGVIPDKKSHQFYPTPSGLAQEAAEWCEISDHHSVLEPSAGQGGLASHVASKDLTCVEVSQLHCEVLRSKFYNTVKADFIKWAPDNLRSFDRVLMNPPFSDGRALEHTKAAFECLKPGGILVAVLPASFAGKRFLDAACIEFSEVKEGVFPDASVSVVLMKATREI